MAKTIYGLTQKQLIGFIVIVAVVMFLIIFYVPINASGQTLHEILFTAPDIIIPQDTDPVACIALFAPVCASDRNTYSNQCFAEASNVEVIHIGECTTFEKIYGFN